MLCVVKKERKVKQAEIMAAQNIITRKFPVPLFIATVSGCSFMCSGLVRSLCGVIDLCGRPALSIRKKSL